MMHSKIVLAGLVIAVSAASAQTDMTLTTAGLGAATIGSTLQQVEKATNVSFQLNPNQRKNWLVEECYISSNSLPGVGFVFERGRLLAVTLGKGARITTRSGIAVGDAERKAIDLLKNDPTYTRGENHYGDGSMTNMEIVVGKAKFNPQRNAYDGMLMKISSVKGSIDSIEAGRASYVALFERENSGECM